MRSYWPAGYLSDLGYDSECSTEWPEEGDVIVIHRPLGRGNLEQILRYRDRGARVLISEDDDLTTLHQTKNPRQDLVDVAQHLACISAADGLIVTTDKLEEVYGAMARESFLCPNYLPAWVAKQKMVHPHPRTNVPRPRPRAQVRVGWAGNVESHLHDLEWLRPVAQRAMSGALFSTIGDPRVPRVLGLTFFEVRDWAWRLHDLYARMSTADIGIVPLAPIEFNESKSWLKALEYMTLGKPVVVSNMPEQAKLVTHGDDGFLADSQEEFADYVQRLIYDHELRARMGERARAKAAGITLENMIDCWYEPLRLREPAVVAG